jgi:peptide/nickel transport system substrate-binding protein
MTKKHYLLALVGMIFALVLAACAPVAPATEQPTDDAPVDEGPFEAIAPLEAECVEGGSEFNKIEATGQHEVTFTLCRPDPAFREKLAFTSFAIQSTEWLEETGGTGELLNHPVGTGPYMLEEWAKGESITFKRFDDYWGEAAKAETLVFRWSPEAAQRLLELESGEVHGIDNVGTDDFEAVEGNEDLNLLLRPALNTFYVGFTVNDAAADQPFADVRVRQAIAMGIDRQRIVDTFMPGGSEVATHFTPCSIPNGCVGDEWYEFDVEAAQALMAEAGYEDGFDTKIYYRDVVRGYLPEPGVVAQDIQAQLAENLNINAEIVVLESGEFIDKATTGQLVDGLHLLGWGADYPQITNFLDFHFGRNQEQFGDAHEEIYGPLETGSQIADPGEAEANYVEANNMIRELVPNIPISHAGSAAAFRADVDGAHVSPLGNEYFATMQSGDNDTFVWMQNAEPISLYCADESDGESLRGCEQVTEALLSYEVGGVAVQPALATGCEPNATLDVWVCTLREGVTFHDGTTFDANDVVFNFSVFLDAANPLHVGNTGSFEYPTNLFGLINPPAPEE